MQQPQGRECSTQGFLLGLLGPARNLQRATWYTVSESSTDPPLDPVEAADTAPDVDGGDWDRSLTGRIQQIVAQPRSLSGDRLPDPTASQLVGIPDDALDDSSFGVDWTFVSTRDSGAKTALPPDVDAAPDDDATPMGYPVVLRRIEQHSASPPEAMPAEALETHPIKRRSEETKPASDLHSDATAPIPNAPHRGFGIVRRPKPRT